MAKREISSTLRNLKFMQRAAQREEKVKKEEEVVKDDGNFASSGTTTLNRKCVVIMEGDPHPGAVIGRMSFQSFNPSIDKLNEEAANVRKTDASTTSSSSNEGRMSFRQNGSSLNGAEDSKVEPNSADNGDLKRKQSEAASEPQYPSKSPKSAQSGQESNPSSSKGANFKQPKREKVDWGVLRPPKSQNKN